MSVRACSRRTDEIGHKEEDVLLVGLLGGQVDGDLCVDDIDGAPAPHDTVGHGDVRVRDGGEGERVAQWTASRLS